MSSPSALFPPDNVPESPAVWVTALRESPRAPGRYAVTLSDGRSFIVAVAALADSGATRVGATLGPAALATLVREAAISDLIAQALGMLARGRRTRRELELRLRRKHPDQALIETALDRLEGSGILSDDDVARAEASSRLRRGQAPTRVRQTLRSKGIAGRDADLAVADAMAEDGFDELGACREAAAKRARSLTSLEPAVARRRLIGFLQRRGFRGAVIRTVLDEQQRNAPDP